MRIVYDKYGIDILIPENKSVSLYIENSTAFSECIRDLWLQFNGKDGGWIVSKENVPVVFNKKCELIVNPWAVDCNSKKVITRLYQELFDVTQEKYLDIYSHINSKVVNFIDDVITDIPYEIGMDLEPDFSNLLKTYNIRIETSDVTLLEKITSYIQVMHRVCGIDFFAFVGLKTYLSEEDLKEFYKMVEYEKVFTVLIQGRFHKSLEMEKSYVLDQDLCIIEL